MQDGVYSPCEGVWLPDGTTRCFIEEFKRDWDYTDHRVHFRVVHRGCQTRQGGRITAQTNKERGYEISRAGGREWGPTQGQRNVESGLLAAISSVESRSNGGHGAAHAGRLTQGRCTRWNISRGKHCSCGRHA